MARAIDRARRLVDALQAPRALKLVDILLRLPTDAPMRYELEALRIEALILEGRFQETERGLAGLRGLAVGANQRQDADLLHAYRLAREAHARAALRTAAPVIREVERRGDRAARGYWVAGVALYRAGHYRWAKECLELSAAHYRITRQRMRLVRVLENLALILKNEGKTHAALERLDEAIQVLPRSGCCTLRVNNQLHRGVCFIRLGQVQNARACLLEAQASAHRAGQRALVNAIHSNLGHIYRMEGNYVTAREFYEETLRAARAAGLSRQQALALEFLAETCIEEGRAVEALTLLDEALAIATPLAGHGDLVMEILRRRGEAKLAIGQCAEGLEDLRRAIELCRARGEVRERLLAERALHLATEAPIDEISARLEALLPDLRRIGDRFEYARTVCFLLEDGRFDAARQPWLAEAATAAAHYFSSMGLRLWKDRLQRVAGHAVHIVPETTSPITARLHSSSGTQSPLFTRALDAAKLAAQSHEPALILGETGSGKEVIGRLVHGWSARAAKPLVGINCGAIPENLIESQLFGHVRGAFTGADRDRPGLFETADGGTVLLDEIGDLSAHIQVKLLRFLDDYEFRRVGEQKVRTVDVRILAATHKDLWKLVRDGVFRQDLLFRLHVFRIQVPALRERPEDIPALVEQFLTEDSKSSPPLRVSPDLMRWMQAHDWPGNVRELRNLCRYLSVRCWGKPEIGVRDLPPEMHVHCVEFLSGTRLPTFTRERLDFERTQIERALRQTDGNIAEASRLLGMGRNLLARRIREHGIDPESSQQP